MNAPGRYMQSNYVRGDNRVQRAIVVFPNFQNIDMIEDIRDKYDPLRNFIRPHITLVFPFESDISSFELDTHVRNTLANYGPFNLVMQGFTASVEAESNYLFLNVTDGLQNLYQLSRGIYTGILAKYQSETYKERYCPHITVGNLGNR